MFYIGSANNLKRRWFEHRKQLRGNYHPNEHLQNAWNKYREENFEFTILEYVVDEIDLVKIEQSWLDWTKCCDRNIGYNKRSQAESNLGFKFSNEFREKRRLIQTGKRPSAETKLKMSIAHKGRKRPDNIGALISAAKKGKGIGEKRSTEYKANMKLAQQKRRKEEADKKFISIISVIEL